MHHLLFGTHCDDGTFSLSYDRTSVFVVGDDGSISHPFDGGGTFVKEVLALKTVEGLKKRIKTLQKK